MSRPDGSSSLKSAAARPLAVVTGGSRGIGAAIAERLALENHDVLLVARGQAGLDEHAHSLRSVYGVNVITVAADLGSGEGVATVLGQIDEMKLAPDVLVNNAGLGASGRFAVSPRASVAGQLDVNVRALTLLTHGLLPGMLARGRGRILNMAGITAFQPVPGMAVHAASKAYVLSFTEALSEELRNSGVTATALCPGFTRTGMLADLGAGELPRYMLQAPSEVARDAWEAMQGGEAVRITGLGPQLTAAWAKWQPRALVRYVSGVVSRFALDY